MSAWINMITPQSSYLIIPFSYACISPSSTQILPLPSSNNFTIFVKVFCRHGRDNATKVSYDYDIALSTKNIAAAS